MLEPITKLLRVMLHNEAAHDWRIHLFVNDITPDLYPVVDDFIEPIAFEYSPLYLLGYNWHFEEQDQHVVAHYHPIYWEFSVPLSIYGYFFTDYFDGVVFAAGRFPEAPLEVAAPGNVLELTPSVCMSGCPTCPDAEMFSLMADRSKAALVDTANARPHNLYK